MSAGSSLETRLLFRLAAAALMASSSAVRYSLLGSMGKALSSIVMGVGCTLTAILAFVGGGDAITMVSAAAVVVDVGAALASDGPAASVAKELSVVVFAEVDAAVDLRSFRSLRLLSLGANPFLFLSNQASDEYTILPSCVCADTY